MSEKKRNLIRAQVTLEIMLADEKDRLQDLEEKDITTSWSNRKCESLEFLINYIEEVVDNE